MSGPTGPVKPTGARRRSTATRSILARGCARRDDETILFWHRGLSLSDIALGHAMLDKAQRLGMGQTLRYA